MALEETKGQLSGTKAPEAPKDKAPVPEPKKETDKTIWGGSQYLKQEEFRRWTKGNDSFRKTGLSESERTKFAKDLFEKEGDYFKTKDAEKTLKKLKEEMAYADTDEKRRDIDKKIKFVEKGILGK